MELGAFSVSLAVKDRLHFGELGGRLLSLRVRGNQNLILDAVIILQTVEVVLWGKGAR